jgi:phosphatidylserine/phosphatidylglycerophosphate/cardiolipin synthase-like enzyme/uncharacterized membrane protein YdjX (TVP38/TMEM64 family)
MPKQSSGPIAVPEENCWRRENARRFAIAIDGEAYFRAVREAILAARKRVFILGWDIHSQLRLVRDQDDDGYPRELGPLLDYVANEHGVDIYLLCWDFAVIYLLERESFPLYTLNWKTHSRVHFQLDSAHPAGGSQHQKLVVIDDRVAFCGGIDLSQWRWDTSEHLVDDERRTDPDGASYPAFHDLEMLVEGDVARALGELARERWQRATGDELAVIEPQQGDAPWPASLEPLLHDIPLAIARTYPAYSGREEVREIERLYLAAIRGAKDTVYIQNQYLTASSIGDALAERLREDEGPELVIVLPRQTGGWLEQQTMDVLRSRMAQRLREADTHDRLRLYYPRLSASADDNLMVHSKLMIVDDQLLRIGSSNLSNRSMGLDSECDLVLEACGDSEIARVIARLRGRLLAQHLGVDVDKVDDALTSHGSLIGAIEALHSDEQTLEPLDTSVDPEIDKLVPESALLDPERPLDPERLVAHFVPEERRQPTSKRMVLSIVTLLLVLLVAAAWRWTPLAEFLDIDQLIGYARAVASHPVAPLLVTAGIALAAAVAVPLTLLVLAAVLGFGVVQGFLYSWAGATLGGLLSYWIGAAAGRDLVRRYAGERLNKVSKQLSRRGVLAILTLRVVPVAPFAVINLVAGASHISLRDFALGTVFGLLPGLLGVSLFAEGLLQSLRNPEPASFGWLAMLVAVLVLGTIWLRKLLRRRQGSS